MIGSARSTSARPTGRENGPTAGSRLVLAAILAATAAFAALLGLSAWHGVRFGLAGVPGLHFVVEGEITAPVELLAGVLEGASGLLVLGAASVLALGWSLGIGPSDRRPAARAAGHRLRRLWRDLEELSRDAVRWARELPRREGRWHVAALVAVVLAGLALRLLYLSGPVRYDEAFTFTHFAVRPAELGLSRYTYPNNHLLHTLLVHLATSAFGSAPAMMRLPAFLAGAAAVPAAYAAWDALGDADEALAAAAVTAVATSLVLYSTNARGYAIVVLCSLLMVPLAARLVRRRDLAARALLCVVATLALHAIPVALYPVGAVLAWMVLSGRAGGEPAGAGSAVTRPRAELLREAGTILLFVAVAVGWLYMPAVQRSGVPAIVANRFVAPVPVGEFLAGVPGFLGDVWSAWTAGWPRPVAAALGAVALLGLGRETGLLGSGEADGGRGGEVPGSVFASYPLVALGWSVLLLAVSRRVSFARIWLFLLPVFGLVLARGGGWAAARIRRWTASGPEGARAGSSAGLSGIAGPAAAAAILVGLGGPVAATDAVVEVEATNPYRDGEEAARLLEERLEEGDGVLASGPAEVVLEYWFRRLGMSGEYLNLRPEPGGTLYVVVHRAEGQTLPDLMARLGVAGSRRIRTREVAELEHSTLYALLPP